MSLGEPVLRVATPDDASPVEALMKESTAALFPLFYDEAQTASAVEYVAHIDPMLLGDGTYYVIESGEEPNVEGEPHAFQGMVAEAIVK